MRFHFVWRTIDNVDVPTIGLPARLAGCRLKTRVRIGNPPVMLVTKLVFNGAWRRISSRPKLLDEMMLLLICAQTFERRSLIVTDDVNHILIGPFLKKLVSGSNHGHYELGFIYLQLGSRRTWLQLVRWPGGQDHRGRDYHN